MNIANKRMDDINGGGKSSPRVGLIPDALPEVRKPPMAEDSHTGVSTRNAPPGSETFAGKRRLDKFRRWYALRTTYGREKKAFEYLSSKNVAAFYPTLTTVKIVGGKKKTVEKSRIPNIFFAYGTEEEIKLHVYDNVNLPFLRFYYRKVTTGRTVTKEPLTVPDHQMESFRIICNAEAKDVILSTTEIGKFKAGQTVKVVHGDFKGVTGIVKRYKGQQRVAVIIEGLLTACTAYIPSAFMESVEQQNG